MRKNRIWGDKEYEALYKEYFLKFYNYGGKFTSDKSIVEDSIQELFLDVWNKKHDLPQIASINSYYFSSFRYILFRKIKHAHKLRPFSEISEEPEFCIEQKIIALETSKEMKQKIGIALDTLTSRQREAIYLRFYMGLSFEEVATVLNITVKSTYKIISRTLIALKEKLALTLETSLLMLSLAFL